MEHDKCSLIRAGRASACLVTMLTLLMLANTFPSGAFALSGSSLQQEVESSPETQTTSTSSTSSTGSSTESGSSHTVILLAMAAAVLLLCGIGFVIVRDARRVAPATDSELAEARAGGRNTAVALRKRRAKARAARTQRKRNR